MLLSIGKDAK